VLAGSLASLSAAADAGSLKDLSAAPSAETKQAIEALTPNAPKSGNSSSAAFKELKVDTTKLNPTQAGSSNNSTVPFVSQHSLLVQFKPDVTQGQIDDFIKSNNFEVVKTFPSLG